MGIAEQFQGAAVSIRKGFGNVPLACEYFAAPAQPDYFPASGLHVWQGAPPTLTGIDIFFVDYTQQERQDAAILPEDDRALVAALDLTDTIPKAGHLLRKPDLSVWEVIAVKTDPATALWDLQIRPWTTGEWPG